jgi:hypothetical protein
MDLGTVAAKLAATPTPASSAPPGMTGRRPLCHVQEVYIHRGSQQPMMWLFCLCCLPCDRITCAYLRASTCPHNMRSNLQAAAAFAGQTFWLLQCLTVLPCTLLCLQPPQAPTPPGAWRSGWLKCAPCGPSACSVHHQGHSSSR